MSVAGILTAFLLLAWGVLVTCLLFAVADSVARRRGEQSGWYIVATLIALCLGFVALVSK